MSLMKSNFQKNSFAVYRYASVSPMKARRILNKLKKFSLEKALIILRYLPHKSSKLFFNLLNSAYYNFGSCSHISKDLVFFKEARVDNASFFKRIQPRAQGKGFPIKKKLSHITSRI